MLLPNPSCQAHLLRLLCSIPRNVRAGWSPCRSCAAALPPCCGVRAPAGHASFSRAHTGLMTTQRCMSGCSASCAGRRRERAACGQPGRGCRHCMLSCRPLYSWVSPRVSPWVRPPCVARKKRRLWLCCYKARSWARSCWPSGARHRVPVPEVRPFTWLAQYRQACTYALSPDAGVELLGCLEAVLVRAAPTLQSLVLRMATPLHASQLLPNAVQQRMTALTRLELVGESGIAGERRWCGAEGRPECCQLGWDKHLEGTFPGCSRHNLALLGMLKPALGPLPVAWFWALGVGPVRAWLQLAEAGCPAPPRRCLSGPADCPPAAQPGGQLGAAAPSAPGLRPAPQVSHALPQCGAGLPAVLEQVVLPDSQPDPTSIPCAAYRPCPSVVHVCISMPGAPGRAAPLVVPLRAACSRAHPPLPPGSLTWLALTPAPMAQHPEGALALHIPECVLALPALQFLDVSGGWMWLVRATELGQPSSTLPAVAGGTSLQPPYQLRCCPVVVTSLRWQPIRCREPISGRPGGRAAPPNGTHRLGTGPCGAGRPAAATVAADAAAPAEPAWRRLPAPGCGAGSLRMPACCTAHCLALAAPAPPAAAAVSTVAQANTCERGRRRAWWRARAVSYALPGP